MKTLTDQEELFIALLEEGLSVAQIAVKLEVSRGRGYQISSKLKDVILGRQRDRLSLGTVRAVTTLLDTLDADATTEKGELRLKAAESILNRTGLTSHTSVEVTVESENGIFLLPGKAIVSPDPSQDDD